MAPTPPKVHSQIDIDGFDREANDAEDAILGALFVSPEIVPQIMAIVAPKCFYRTTERAVFRMICDAYAEGRQLDVGGIVRQMRLEGLSKGDNYGSAWIAHLAQRAHVGQAITHDAPQLRRLAQLRTLQQLGAAASDPTANPDQLIAAINNPELTQITSTGSPLSYYSLLESNPRLNEPVVDGLLRRGETCNIIAAPKVGKSFLAINLAWSVATGRPWLGFDVKQGRVLIIDNELHQPTLARRIDNAAHELGISHPERAETPIDVLCLRGRLCDIHQLHNWLLRIDGGHYQLVILDALYRTLPQGASENDNAAMMGIYNRLDQYAANLDSAFVVVHHSSKGNQADKGITDVGAGAGSISRAADTHLVIRPHASDGHAVLEAVTRSFKSPEPISIKFEYPLWTATTLAPEVKQAARGREVQQAAQDAETDAEVLAIIAAQPKLSLRQIREQTTYGETRVQRSIVRLRKAGQIEGRRVKSRRTGKVAERYRVIDVPRDVPRKTAGHVTGHHDVPHATTCSGAGHGVTNAVELPPGATLWDAESQIARLSDVATGTSVNDVVMPRRVQRKRTKGYRLPPNTVSVCRPGKFGNPFKPGEYRAAGYEGTDLEIQQRCVDDFRAWLVGKDGWLKGDEADRRRAEILDGLELLRGKNLACYCKLDEPCHADVLLELANSSAENLPFGVRRLANGEGGR